MVGRNGNELHYWQIMLTTITEIKVCEDFDEDNLSMPQCYRIFFWIDTILIVLLTLWVWTMAYLIWAGGNEGRWVPFDEFRLLLLGFHAMILIVSVIGMVMQTYWKEYGNLELYPLAMVIGTAILIVTAVKMTLVFLPFM